MHNFLYRKYPVFTSNLAALFVFRWSRLYSLPAFLIALLFMFSLFIMVCLWCRWSTISWRKTFMMFIDETFVRAASLCPVSICVSHSCAASQSLSVSCINETPSPEQLTKSPFGRVATFLCYLRVSEYTESWMSMSIWSYISLDGGCKGFVRCVLPKRCSLKAVHIYHIYIIGQSPVSHIALKQLLQLLFFHPCQSPWCVSWLEKDRIGAYRLLYRAALSVKKGFFFFQSEGCIQYTWSGIGRCRNKEGRYDKV